MYEKVLERFLLSFADAFFWLWIIAGIVGALVFLIWFLFNEVDIPKKEEED